MPKMKTKKSVQKRFRLTGTGKVVRSQVGKQHGMIKRSNKFIRQARGTTVCCEPNARLIRRFLPYA